MQREGGSGVEKVDAGVTGDDGEGRMHLHGLMLVLGPPRWTKAEGTG